MTEWFYRPTAIRLVPCEIVRDRGVCVDILLSGWTVAKTVHWSRVISSQFVVDVNENEGGKAVKHWQVIE